MASPGILFYLNFRSFPTSGSPKETSSRNPSIGPTVDLVLQCAKYKDASDQCSLSRILEGIHPPIDDIPGRIIGEKIGIEAFDHAIQYFNGNVQPEKRTRKNH